MASRRRGAATSGANGDGRGERYRRKSIEKRTQGLCKKAYELATLCDIDVALISYLPGADSATIWPPDRHKIEQVIHRYLDTPAHKKLPKNQITLDISNPAAENTKDAGKASAEADANRLPIPFPYDEDRLIAFARSLDSTIADVRRLLAVRRTEWRSDPGPSDRHRGMKAALGPAPALSSASGSDGNRAGADSGTADRDRGKRVARDYGPVRGWWRPDFSDPAPAMATAAMGGGVAPNSSCPFMCCSCPDHGRWFTGFGGRDASRDGSDGN